MKYWARPASITSSRRVPGRSSGSIGRRSVASPIASMIRGESLPSRPKSESTASDCSYSSLRVSSRAVW